ncbi:MAG: outer membrane protein assembly factor BamA [Deltaproteobacteria bacterium]|nr:outer membrane protein assembly factor BamA [Deltaproteobacteria bacterium]
MGIYKRKDRDRGMDRSWCAARCFGPWIPWVLVMVGLALSPPGILQAQEAKIVAVLPFRVHALQPMDQLREQIQGMLTERLAKEGLRVVSPDVVNSHPLARLPLTETKDVVTLGKDVKADFVILGSLTHVGKKISLDLKALDVSSRKPPFSLFIVEDDVDRLAEATEMAATNLYNQIAGVVQIDSIVVRGNRRIESDAILAVLQCKKGDPLDQEKIDKDLRAIFAMGFFKDVNIDTEDGPKGKVVVIHVNEKPSISSIGFTGNQKEKEEDLKKESGIKLYAILNQSEIKQSINRLKEYYRQKGYYNVEIRDTVKELPSNEVSLVYEVDEGSKLYITKILFEGNTQFSERKLKGLMETSEKGLFSWITKSGLLDKKKLEFDCHKIASFYHNHGYIKAKTGEPEVKVEETGLTVRIQIIEGDQYMVNEVRVEGELLKPEEELLKKTAIKKEKYFNREVVRKDSLALREIYANEGFAYAEVVPVTREDDKTHQVDITYKITKNKKVRFERINIAGNTVTRDKVIRRELKAVEGNTFSGHDMKRSIQNLHRLGFFDDVEVQTKKGSQDDLMVLDVNVKERPTGSFSFGAGYSSFDNMIATFNIAQNNLMGRGQKLSATAYIGSKTQQFDIRFTEPWLLDKDLSMDIDLFNFKRQWYEYTKDSMGGALRFAFPIGLDEFTKGFAGYGYEDADITDVWDHAAYAIQDMKGRNVTSSVTLGIRRNSKDRPWDTREGSLNSISFEYAGDPLGGTVAFEKYLATTCWYFPMPWNTVLMAQGRWGYVEQREADGKLPVYQKFRIGGINTIRGFDDYDVSPKDPATNDPIGGECMQIYNLEYRFPLFKEQGIKGLVFFDVGNSTTKDDGFTFSDIKKSVGTGMRWYSPVGPLRLEYGWVIGPEGDDPSGNWHFSVGGVF